MIFHINCDPQYYKNKDMRSVLDLPDFSGMEQAPRVSSPGENDSFTVEVPDADLREFLLAISDAVIEHGMDDQETVNETGKKLYWLYDELLIQKQESE